MTGKPTRRTTPRRSDLTIGTAIVAKSAVEMLPGGSILTGLWHEHIERVKDAASKDQQERLADFYRGLLQGDEIMDRARADALFDDGDFHALLRACLSDIESEKTAAYATFARAIATGRVDKAWRRHFILSLRDISAGGLARLQKAFVARRHQLVPSAGPTMDESHFLNPAAPGTLDAIVIHNLTAKGFVAEAKLTPAGMHFVETCIKPGDLTPAAIGFREWTGLNVAVIDCQLSDGKHDRLTQGICNELRKHCVKSQILAVGRQIGAGLLYTHGVLLVGNRNEHLNSNVEHLKRFMGRKPLLVLSTVSPNAVLPTDIKPRSALDVSTQDEASIIDQVRTFVFNERARSLEL